MRWVRVANESDVQDVLATVVDGHRVALFRLETGVFALDDICSHEYARLSEGEVWDQEVSCPKHGSRFNIRTGAVTGLPATQPVRSYPVKVEGGGVYLLWTE